MYKSEKTDSILENLLDEENITTNRELIKSMISTTIEMNQEGIDRLNLKIASKTLEEILNTWTVFSPYDDKAKVSIFGSARTNPDDPDYQLALEFSKLMAERDWMSITGAGPGIMEAGIAGSGVENSFGVSILLPFEAKPAKIIRGDEKLVKYKYFFTRKLTFMKETDAFALFPGGFGTQDEAFELLTLIQTGKSYPAPIVLLDNQESSYWDEWQNLVNTALLKNKMISESDIHLYKHTHDPVEAVEYLCSFYSTYHSVRNVRAYTIIRLNKELSDRSVEILNEEFKDIIKKGQIVKSEATKIERKDNDCVNLPRLKFHFDNRSFGRLHMLIDRINELGGIKGADATENLVHDVSPEEF